jgi:hypothetical protein
MRRRHRFDGGPSQGMLAFGELLEAFLVTLGASLRCDRTQLVNVLCRLVATFVTVAATNVFCVMPADLPVVDDIACFFAMTIDAIVCKGELAAERENDRKRGHPQ